MLLRLKKYLAFAMLFGVLAFGLHSLVSSREMSDGGEMDASCSTVCISQGDISQSAMNIAVLWLVPLLAVFALVVSEAKIFSSNFERIFHKDRHRYLMKTAVMLR